MHQRKINARTPSYEADIIESEIESTYSQLLKTFQEIKKRLNNSINFERYLQSRMFWTITLLLLIFYNIVNCYYVKLERKRYK